MGVVRSAFNCLPTLVARSQSRTVAITVDDLVCANCPPTNQDETFAHGLMEATTQSLIAGLSKADIPVTGFVIVQTVEEAHVIGQRCLQHWLNAGFDLGNHSYSHRNFADITIEQMKSDIARADASLRPLLAANQRILQFFRFPYNCTGDTQLKHDALADYLKEHGYRIATCTIDTSDYLFAQAYARAIGSKDSITADRIRREYLSFSATEIDFYAELNRRVLGYEPPQVMLIHDSMLNAESINDILTLFRDRGYGFVSLAEAQCDPAYAIPDTYITKHGPMWGYRWAKARNDRCLGMNEPHPPDWVTNYVNGTFPRADNASYCVTEL